MLWVHHQRRYTSLPPTVPFLTRASCDEDLEKNQYAVSKACGRFAGPALMCLVELAKGVANILNSHVTTFALRDHNPCVRGSSPSSATNKFNGLHRECTVHGASYHGPCHD